jgi:hypothetical protein
MNPALKKALWPVLALVFGALATYFSTGCSGAPSLPPEVPQALAAARCVDAALKGVDPEALTLKEALELGEKVKACLPKPPAGGGAPDAGVR